MLKKISCTAVGRAAHNNSAYSVEAEKSNNDASVNKNEMNFRDDFKHSSEVTCFGSCYIIIRWYGYIYRALTS